MKQISGNYVSRNEALFFSSHVQKFPTMIEYKSTAHISWRLVRWRY